jgi:hypothetical protein
MLIHSKEQGPRELKVASSTEQYRSSIQFSAVQCSSVHFTAVKDNAAPCNAG